MPGEEVARFVWLFRLGGRSRGCGSREEDGRAHENCECGSCADLSCDSYRPLSLASAVFIIANVQRRWYILPKYIHEKMIKYFVYRKNRDSRKCITNDIIIIYEKERSYKLVYADMPPTGPPTSWHV